MIFVVHLQPRHNLLANDFAAYSASSAHYHMLSPSSRGLFHKAISQSGVAASTFAFNEQPREQAKIFAQQLYCPTEPAEEMVHCIQARSTIEILQVHAQASVRPIIGSTCADALV